MAAIPSFYCCAPPLPSPRPQLQATDAEKRAADSDQRVAGCERRLRDAEGQVRRQAGPSGTHAMPYHSIPVQVWLFGLSLGFQVAG